MGAADFITKAVGKTAKEAFNNARNDALYEYGHGGYTGTIAEKHSFDMVGSANGLHAAFGLAQDLLDADDPRIEDKWGPAGCIRVDGAEEYGKRVYVFFGWASS
jgi:hypothetical protein